MKTLTIILILALAVPAYAGIVNNSGSTGEDSVSVPLYALDSAGNVVPLDTTQDWGYITVRFPNGDTAATDSFTIKNNNLKTKVTGAKYGGEQEATYRQAVASIDGPGIEGTYSYLVMVRDSSEELWTPIRGEFQVYATNNFSTWADQLDATISSRSSHTAANVVDEWETQSQADPTGFHVNVKEWTGFATGATDVALTDAPTLAALVTDSVWLAWIRSGDLPDTHITGPDTTFAYVMRSIVDSLSHAITSTNKANFKADVSGLSTFDNTTDKVTLVDSSAADISQLGNLLVYGGGVWVDTINGAQGVVVGVNGTIANPVMGIPQAKTIADAIGFKRIFIVNADYDGDGDTVYNIQSTMADYEFVGVGAPSQTIVSLNGQTVDGSRFTDLSIQGTQGGSESIFLDRCIIKELLTFEGYAKNCWLTDSISMKLSANIFFDNCQSGVAGNAAPSLDFGPGASDVSFRHWSGGLWIWDMDGSDRMSIEGQGNVLATASCSAAPITVRGMFTVSKENPSDANFTYTATAQYLVDSMMKASDTLELPDNIWTHGTRTLTGAVDLNADQSGVTIGVVDSVGHGGTHAISLHLTDTADVMLASDTVGLAADVWSHGTRTLTGTGGLTYDANVVQVSGSAPAADSLESVVLNAYSNNGTGNVALWSDVRAWQGFYTGVIAHPINAVPVVHTYSIGDLATVFGPAAADSLEEFALRPNPKSVGDTNHYTLSGIATSAEVTAVRDSTSLINAMIRTADGDSNQVFRDRIIDTLQAVKDSMELVMDSLAAQVWASTGAGCGTGPKSVVFFAIDTSAAPDDTVEFVNVFIQNAGQTANMANGYTEGSPPSFTAGLTGSTSYYHIAVAAGYFFAPASFSTTAGVSPDTVAIKGYSISTTATPASHQTTLTGQTILQGDTLANCRVEITLGGATAMYSSTNTYPSGQIVVYSDGNGDWSATIVGTDSLSAYIPEGANVPTYCVKYKHPMLQNGGIFEACGLSIPANGSTTSLRDILAQ